MRAVIQRVTRSSVRIPEQSYEAGIGAGLLILLGIEEADTIADVQWLVKKIIGLRIFSDEAGKMNMAVSDIKGEILVISQFTLHASTRKGNRPSFIKAARPPQAIPLYRTFIESIEKEHITVKQGIFGADMKVQLINDGPVTIIIDSKQRE